MVEESQGLPQLQNDFRRFVLSLHAVDACSAPGRDVTLENRDCVGVVRNRYRRAKVC